MQAALAERKARALEIVLSRNLHLVDHINTRWGPDAVHNLALFNKPGTHRISVNQLALDKLTSAEREMRRNGLDIEIVHKVIY